MKITLSRNNVVWLLCMALVLFAFTFVYQRGQDQNWDLLNYHYFAGYSLLHGRFLHDITPVNLASFFNPATNILGYFSLSHLTFPASAWVILSVQLLSLPILVVIARQLGRELGYSQFGVNEFLALVLCLLGPLWWSELGTTFSSSTTTPIVLLGLHLGLRGIIQEDEASNVFILSGIFFGLSAGLKLTNAPFAVAFFFALLVVSIRYQRQHALSWLLKLTVGMVIGFAVTAWWNIYLLQRWGSPFFPLYNAWFKSPYYSETNLRDSRWYFGSIMEFSRYVWDAATGTNKTSEITFADPRILMLFALSPLALWVRKRTNPMSKGVLLLVLFFGVGYFLWCIMFAYQRYLIPIELLFGFVIWILLSRLTTNTNWIIFLLTGCILYTGAFMKVPDWGHIHSRLPQSNPFGLKLPDEISSTPAQYLVVGDPMGYILPFLHPDSRFYGLNFSAKVNALILATVKQDVALPLRILANQAGSFFIWNTLSGYGVDQHLTYLTCSHFRSNIDAYVVCEISKLTEERAKSFSPIEINFQDANSVLPSAVLGFSGLSGPEPGGRWSDGDVVTVNFANCLPAGKLRINLRGHAFGPNISSPVNLKIGSSETSFVFVESDRDLMVAIENSEQCQKSLSILVPEKKSPQELGISEDTRQLGIKLVQLRIVEQK